MTFLTICKMPDFFKLLLIFLIHEVGGKSRNKFVYEKEISEHCLRRVMPSVFLGRHVMDAYAQVLYFSKSDLPYSCYVSVRAESGSNIILVVQLLSAEDLMASCATNANQLLVYEMGETFGGYWGPIPQSFIKNEDNSSKSTTRAQMYTLKHKMETIPISTTESTTTTERSTTPQENIENQPFVEQQSYITIEVPLVNVSGRYEPGEEDKESAFEQENFDLIYDVLPRRNKQYSTTMVPLVKFSVGEDTGDRRWGYDDLMSGYSFGQNFNTFTPDYRLKHQKYNASVNRRLKFKHNTSRWPLPHKNTSLFSAIYDDSKMMQPKKPSKYMTIADIKTNENKINEESEAWPSIEELISAYNDSGSLTTVTTENEMKQDIPELLNKLSIDNNQSAYLNFPWLQTKIDFTTKTTINPFTRRPILSSSDETVPFHVEDRYKQEYFNITTITSLTTSINSNHIEVLSEKLNDNSTHAAKSVNNITEPINTEMTLNFTVIDIEETDEQSNLNTTVGISLNDTVTTEKETIIEPAGILKQRTSTMTGSLLDHESWENLVRVAPVMAGRLDENVANKIIEELQHESEMKTNASTLGTNVTEALFQQTTDSKTVTRDKRFIQGIMIEEAKPHRLSTKEDVATTTSSSIHISDIQQFAQLVELIDDDMHDRAALRYLSQYVGQPMFNLCHYDQPKPRYVRLFKSSRLVLAIDNFTLRSMQLVITPARMLFTGKSRCEQSHLECQVAGNRVCIDSMSACDGVANCGAPDIYDEDRLMCGAYVGLRHNVCLAAITFIAVLLTVIYIVHYWLGRCVPKVSEAFFIYTEGDENILYLDTIMRSPHDTTNEIPGFKSIDTIENEVIFSSDIQKESKMRTWLQRLLPCCFKKTDKNMSISEDWGHFSPTNTTFSFPELEIRRMANQEYKDTSVQTGESLEMKYLSLKRQSLIKSTAEGEDISASSEQPVVMSPTISSDEQQRVKDELSLLKLLNKSRFDSLTTRTTYNLSKYEESLTELSSNNEFHEELEIQSQFYETRRGDHKRDSQVRAPHSSKHKAYTEKPKMQSKCLRFSEEVVNIPRKTEYSDDEISPYEKRKLDTIDESAPSTSRDFKRFWGGSKEKKTKKKTQTLTR